MKNATTTNARRARAARAIVSAAAPIVEAPAPIVTPAPVVETPAPAAPPAPTPAPEIPLANRTGAEIFSALRAFATDDMSRAAAGVLCAVGGNLSRALGWVGAESAIVVLLNRAAALRSILGKTAPRECFLGDFANPAGVKIGDLYASALGLSALYRADNRAAMKTARENARKLSAE